MISPKEYYSTYLANDELCEIDEMLIKQVLKERPTEVFDFGTGTGKNLRLLQDRANYPITLCGLDVSLLGVIHARTRNDIPFVILGDEYFLCRLTSFDVSMTCSVLCHIENIEDIIRDLKLLTRKSIIIAETTDIVGEYYFKHDYQAFGFMEMGKEWFSEANGANYKLYKWIKNDIST